MRPLLTILSPSDAERIDGPGSRPRSNSEGPMESAPRSFPIYLPGGGPPSAPQVGGFGELLDGRFGMCPQVDPLWEGLSGRQHLNFFGRLAGGEIRSGLCVSLQPSRNLDALEPPRGRLNCSLGASQGSDRGASSLGI